MDCFSRHCSAFGRAILTSDYKSRKVSRNADLIFDERGALGLSQLVFGRVGDEPVKVARQIWWYCCILLFESSDPC